MTRSCIACSSTSWSVRFTERLDEIGAGPSFDETVDSFENALAEMTKGLYKTGASTDPTL